MVVAAIGLLVALAAPARAQETSALPGPIVSIAWLASHLDDPRVGVIATGGDEAGRALGAQEPATGAEEVLLGFDPILLIAGKEELGDERLAVERDGFKYLFVSEENRRTFERDPARYGVQLGGVCARMGDTVRGSADNYAVVNGRIYLFGSRDCREAFTANPGRYLEPPVEPVEAGAEAVARGRALVSLAVEAMGGAAAVEAVASYRLEMVQTSTRPDGTVQERQGALLWLLPGRLRGAPTRAS